MACPTSPSPQPSHGGCASAGGVAPLSGWPRTLDSVPPPELGHDSGGTPANANAPSPDHPLGPRVTILVHHPGQDPLVLHALQVPPEPLVILTLTFEVQPLLRALPGPMNILAVHHHIFLWDASVVHTLPSQDQITVMRVPQPSLSVALPTISQPPGSHYSVITSVHRRPAHARPH